MSEDTQRKLAAIVSADVVGYSRVAMTLSLPKDASVHDLVQPDAPLLAAAHAFGRGRYPRVKQNVHTDSDIDLCKIPVPRWYREDGERYINTYQATVTMDADTGCQNIGIYRETADGWATALDDLVHNPAGSYRLGAA